MPNGHRDSVTHSEDRIYDEASCDCHYCTEGKEHPSDQTPQLQEQQQELVSVYLYELDALH